MNFTDVWTHQSIPSAWDLFFSDFFFILQKRSYDTEFGTIYLRPEQVSQPKPTFTSFSCNFQVIRKNINSDLVNK